MRCCMASGSWVARLNKLLRLVLLAIRVQAAAELETSGGSAHWNSSANISIACVAGWGNEVWVSRPTTLLIHSTESIHRVHAFGSICLRQGCPYPALWTIIRASVTTARGMMPSLLGAMLTNELSRVSSFVWTKHSLMPMTYLSVSSRSTAFMGGRSLTQIFNIFTSLLPLLVSQHYLSVPSS